MHAQPPRQHRNDAGKGRGGERGEETSSHDEARQRDERDDITAKHRAHQEKAWPARAIATADLCCKPLYLMFERWDDSAGSEGLNGVAQRRNICSAKAVGHAAAAAAAAAATLQLDVVQRMRVCVCVRVRACVRACVQLLPF